MALGNRGVMGGVSKGVGVWSLCAVIAGCGGGGGGSASSAAPTAHAFVISGAGACVTRNGCINDSFVFHYSTSGGGGGGGGGSGSGAGAGGGQSAMRNVTVTAYKPDGSELGHADLVDNVVSLYPGSYTGPFILKFADNGSGQGAYFDELINNWVNLNGASLHILVPTLSHHISANPLTEAAYQYALSLHGSEAALNATNMAAANAAVLVEINRQLPRFPVDLRSDDITNYTTTIDNTSGPGTLDVTNKAGRYGAVLASMPIAASIFRNRVGLPPSSAPALTYGAQLAADMADNGQFDGSVRNLAYHDNSNNDNTMSQDLFAGTCDTGGSLATYGPGDCSSLQ
jgi:hypothetical protein